MILTEAFGDSSNSEGEEEEQFLHVHSVENKVNGKALIRSVFGETHNWERISEIDGLWLCKDFLSPDQQSKLLSSIQQGNSPSLCCSYSYCFKADLGRIFWFNFSNIYQIEVKCMRIIR